jgi:hypothetical protein
MLAVLDAAYLLTARSAENAHPVVEDAVLLAHHWAI